MTAKKKQTKGPFTFESNVKAVIEKVEETPFKVMNIIGQNLVKEIRTNVPKKSGKLRKSLAYWARKDTKDLQIGWYDPKKKPFAAFYSHIVMGQEKDPIKPVVVKNAELIKEMIAEALDQIRKG